MYWVSLDRCRLGWVGVGWVELGWVRMGYMGWGRTVGLGRIGSDRLSRSDWVVPVDELWWGMLELDVGLRVQLPRR